MTSSRPEAPIENVAAGAILSLLAIPVGVIILGLLSSVGIVASIVGFVVAYSAVWLYKRASGGIISRTGAWIVTAVVIGTLLLGMWVSSVVQVAGGLGDLGNIGDPRFWPVYNELLPKYLQSNGVYLLLTLAFGAIGAFRTLGRAFATTRVITPPNTTIGSPDGPPQVSPTVYQNDVDAPPTGSADDKTAPPTSGS